MIRICLGVLTALTLTALLLSAQPAAPQMSTGTLAVLSDNAGTFLIDGEAKATLTPEKVATLSLTAGQHFAEFRDSLGQKRWDKIIVIPVGAQIVEKISLVASQSPAASSSPSRELSATVSAGIGPAAVAVNPVTNKIYVANRRSNNVTVIDGTTNATITVTAGMGPNEIVVNPVTNKIYVENFGSNSVTVIDDATNVTATIPTGLRPEALAIDTEANTIYVSNSGSNSVTVINGANNSTRTVSVGAGPMLLMLNPTANKVYVGNGNSKSMTIIDRRSQKPTGLLNVLGWMNGAVNPVTNRVYVANFMSDLTMIDGVTNRTNSIGIAPGRFLSKVAVNSTTNRIYVVNFVDTNTPASVAVIDGETASPKLVPVGAFPVALEVNPTTNKIYVANFSSNTLTVIDGATNATITANTGTKPSAIGINQVTKKIYVANAGSNDISIFDEATIGESLHPPPAAAQAAQTNGDPDVRREIDSIARSGQYSPLPEAQMSLAKVPNRVDATRIIRNDTAYALHVLMTGPIDRRIDLSPGGSTSIPLPPGSYRVAARVDSPGVVPFYGVQALEVGVEYTSQFYIK